MNTHELNRREFLSMAGAAPLGLAAHKYLGKISPLNDPIDMYYDPWLEINTQNFEWNVRQVRKRVENRPIMAVIKCNGYGHGLVGTAKALGKNGIDKFAVVKVQEAVDLRKNDIRGMILNFGPFSSQEAEVLVDHDISQSVFSHAVDDLAAAARRLGKQALVHIKVDTGLGRVGVPHDEAFYFIEKVGAMPDIKIEGIFTTLTEEPEYDKIQVERLVALSQEAEKKGVHVGLKHAASSLAVAKSPGTFLDMVRPGNCLYGIESLPNLDLKPVMSLKTRIILVKQMQPGQTVAYHRRYKIEKDTLLVTLPLGYADGYPFTAVNKAEVLIQGRRWPMVAYMSANHVFVDVSGNGTIKIGDEVVLFGAQKGNEITIAEVAEWGGSSVYKVPILMNPLMPRIFL